jgi:hypothetical protein
MYDNGINVCRMGGLRFEPRPLKNTRNKELLAYIICTLKLYLAWIGRL